MCLSHCIPSPPHWYSRKGNQTLAANRSVLLVDDDELSREVLSILLEAEGYRVACASSGEDALLSLSTAPKPGIVLTDLQMPGLSGSSLARQLRTLCGPATHLFVMSAGTPDPSLTELYDAFLPKPLSVDDFTRALDGQQPTSATALPHPAILDEAIYARLAFTLPRPQLVALYRFCLADALDRLASLRAAADRLDQDTLHRQAHTLRGGCGMVGATEIGTLAATLENLRLHAHPPPELQALLDTLAEAHERLQSTLELRWRADA